MSTPLAVVFQDAQVVVVGKPAGVHTAPLGARERGTLLESVLSNFPEIASVPGVLPREPGLLHRLDRETSGLVLFARTPSAFAALRESFNAEGASKDYAACSPPPPAGLDTGGMLTVTSRFAPWGPGRKRVRVVLPSETRRNALRQATPDSYTTEARVAARGPRAFLLEVRIHRGFRHQVRVHLAHLGFPLLGDPLYGIAVPAGAAPRMYLHACALSFPHPATGKLVRVEFPLPPEFTALLA